MNQPITSGNMHAQMDKCAYVRNHGHNNMGADMPLMVGHVRTRAYPYICKRIDLFVMVGTVVYLLAL